MKTISKIIYLAVLTGVSIAFGYVLAQQAHKYPDPFKTVTEQMKSIQQQVGCELIDADPGPETRRLVNAKVKEEKRELCNQYAIESFARMSKGDKK